MSIDKANILIFVNRALKTVEADGDIDIEIQTILDDLSEEDLLEATLNADDDDGITLAAGQSSFDLPADWRDYSAITLTTQAGVNQDPLQAIPGGIDQLRAVKSNDSGTGTPQWYTVFGTTVEIWRPSSGIFTVKQEYTKNHPQSVKAIEFLDIFKNAINFGTTAEVSARLNRTAGINLWLPKYLAAKQKRINAKPMQPSISRGQIWEW